MTEAIRTAAPEIVLAACRAAAVHPPAEDILAAGLFGEAERTIERLLANPNEGSFRMGARSMRDHVETDLKDLIKRREEAKSPKNGTAIIGACLGRIMDMPLPEMPLITASKGDGWGWWAGSTEEFMNHGGPERTREDAIAVGRDAADGEGFHIVEARLAEYKFSAERVIEDMLENAETVYEDYAEIVAPADEAAAATAELQSLLDGWVARHPSMFTPATSFRATRNLEFIEGDIAEHQVSA